MDAHEGVAAWVQAIGSIGAIWATGRIARGDRAERARTASEAADRIARDHAITLMPSLKAWEKLAAGWVSCLNADGGEALWIAVFQVIDNEAAFTLPAAVSEMQGRYHELGSASTAVQKAVIAHHEFTDFRPRAVALDRQAGKEFTDAVMNEAEAFEDILRRYCAAVANACRAVRRLLD